MFLLLQIFGFLALGPRDYNLPSLVIALFACSPPLKVSLCILCSYYNSHRLYEVFNEILASNKFILFSVETYLSPVETHCTNIDYFIPDTENRTKDFNDYAMTRLRKYRNIFFWVVHQPRWLCMILWGSPSSIDDLVRSASVLPCIGPTQATRWVQHGLPYLTHDKIIFPLITL